MNMQTHRPWPWFFLAFAVLAADQAAKSAIDAATPLGWCHPITSFFNLVHVLNPGAAFSFLAGAGGWQRWFFLGIAIMASVWLIWMLRQPRPRSESLAFSLILGARWEMPLIVPCAAMSSTIWISTSSESTGQPSMWRI